MPKFDNNFKMFKNVANDCEFRVSFIRAWFEIRYSDFEFLE